MHQVSARGCACVCMTVVMVMCVGVRGWGVCVVMVVVVVGVQRLGGQGFLSWQLPERMLVPVPCIPHPNHTNALTSTTPSLFLPAANHGASVFPTRVAADTTELLPQQAVIVMNRRGVHFLSAQPKGAHIFSAALGDVLDLHCFPQVTHGGGGWTHEWQAGGQAACLLG